jgi:hypothetical protein
MSAITITPQGHLILEKDMLDHLGASVGNTIIVEKLPNGRIELRVGPEDADIKQAFGLLRHHATQPLTIEQIEAAVQKGWAGKR